MTIKEAREIFEEDNITMTDEQLQQVILFVEQMSSQMLDAYEIKTFGKTVKELVRTT